MIWEGMRKDNRILAGFSRIKATEASPPLFLSFFFFKAVEKSQTKPTTHQNDPNWGSEAQELGHRVGPE